MPEPACAGSSSWIYTNARWVVQSDNCSGTCPSPSTCKASMPKPGDPIYEKYRDIIENPHEGALMPEGGCSCQ